MFVLHMVFDIYRIVIDGGLFDVNPNILRECQTLPVKLHMIGVS